MARTARASATIKVERSPGSYQKMYFEESVERFRQQRAARALARQAQDDAPHAVVAS